MSEDDSSADARDGSAGADTTAENRKDAAGDASGDGARAAGPGGAKGRKLGEGFTVEVAGEERPEWEDYASAGAAHSLARLFEGTVTNQLHANNIQMATTTACVIAILEGRPRELPSLFDLKPPKDG